MKSNLNYNQIGWYDKESDLFFCNECFEKVKNVRKEKYEVIKREDLNRFIFTCDECGKEFDLTKLEHLEERKNFVRFIGGGLLIFSAIFLPWGSIIFGKGTLLELHDLTQGLIKFFGDGETSGQNIFLWIFFLILIGGICGIFRPVIGGIIGLIGLLLFTLIAISAGKELGMTGFGFLANGYYVAWIGVIFLLFSQQIYKTIKKKVQEMIKEG